MSKVKIRAFSMAVVAVAILVVFAAIAAKVMGYDVPGLSAITNAIGME
jgi:hypothetical protein